MDFAKADETFRVFTKTYGRAGESKAVFAGNQTRASDDEEEA
jgi:hypothetical protein